MSEVTAPRLGYSSKCVGLPLIVRTVFLNFCFLKIFPKLYGTSILTLSTARIPSDFLGPLWSDRPRTNLSFGVTRWRPRSPVSPREFFCLHFAWRSGFFHCALRHFLSTVSTADLALGYLLFSRRPHRLCRRRWCWLSLLRALLRSL